jgi:AraC-like DNA-binding protein
MPIAEGSKPAGPSPRGSVLGWVVPLLAGYVKECGHDGEPILRLPGIRGRDLDDPDVRVPESAAGEAWRMAIGITEDDALGLHLALWVPRGGLELVEFAFRSSPSLGVGLERLAHYGRLINDHFTAHVVRTATDLKFVTGAAEAPPMHPQRTEFAMAMALRLAREATATDLIPTEVCFAHPAPTNLIELRRFFRAPLLFSADLEAISFSNTDGARPLRSADAALAATIHRRLDKALTQLDRPGDASTAARVRRVLVETMGQGNPSVTTIGREMGLSARTLSRRLVEEGTSFRQIRDHVRSQLAAALMSDASVSIAEVAFFLGYAEPAPFHRSFKRWTGKTPQAYRRSRLGD